MAEAVIVSSVRTPVGRGYKGSLRTTRPDDLAALVIKEALARVPALTAVAQAPAVASVNRLDGRNG